MPIQIEVSHIFWLILGSVIPVILFWKKLHGMTKRTLDMLLDPDSHGFGTKRTNELLIAQMKDETERHRVSISATRSLQHTIRELTHYVRWDTSERTGRQPPPFIDAEN